MGVRCYMGINIPKCSASTSNLKYTTRVNILRYLPQLLSCDMTAEDFFWDKPNRHKDLNPSSIKADIHLCSNIRDYHSEQHLL